MPVTIYALSNPSPEITLLCDGEWSLSAQIHALEGWLLSIGRFLPKDEYVVDVGFQWRRDAGGGGSALSPEAMKVMGEVGLSLFLSEYPGFIGHSEV